MEFELLPNEILFKCFKYLNGVDIFHSFDQLNYRFNRLIRSIPLYVDFQHIPMSVVNEFCVKMESDEEIQRQTYSLHLSNKDTSHIIDPFLSLMSLDKFTQLHSLTLTELTVNNKSKLRTMLLPLSQLSYLRLIDFEGESDKILPLFLISSLRTLTVSELRWDFNLMDFPSITNLTIIECYLHYLYKLLETSSHLRYLSIQKMSYGTMWNSSTIKDINLPNLKQLIILEFRNTFDNLIIILKQTPMLKSLTISTYGTETGFIDACKWQDVISSSLPYLKVFNFHFMCFYEDKSNDILYEKFKEFQSDFWCKQHHWYTEYSLFEALQSIYTIPYIFDKYQLRSNIYKYSIDNSNTFQTVRNLVINPNALTEKYQYYFSHPTSLTLGDPWYLFRDHSIKLKQIEYLKKIVNLSNVKHLNILYSSMLETPSALKQILNEAPQISSLEIGEKCLKQLLNDNELCEYLNRRLQVLEIHDFAQGSTPYLFDSNKFCETFSNIEQLTCKIGKEDTVIYLIKHLPKLLRINIPPFAESSSLRKRLSENQSHKLSEDFITHVAIKHNGEISIWIVREMNKMRVMMIN